MFRLALSLFFPVASAEKWAVIAAGSSGFWNYRHQADSCHAYQLMVKSGVPAENIILMMQDDVANDSENPFKGQLYNKPGNDSPDVYKGCQVDYSGKKVTAQLFMDVLTGNAQRAKGKVLKSTEKDTVFVNFVDHGGVGLVAFPNGPVLHVKELSKTLKTMQSQKMFKQLVFYMEACESGSMFPDLTSDGKILAVTASNAKESSWGTYCGDEAVVKGKSIGSCLGDLFSVNWMQDDDLGKYSSETFRSQIQKITKLTNKSHVCSFGDKSFENEAIGDVEALAATESMDVARGSVDTRDIYVNQAFWAWNNAAAEDKEAAWKKLVQVVKSREADDAVFQSITSKACSDVNKEGCQKKLQGDQNDVKEVECHYNLVHTLHQHCPASESHYSKGGWNGYNMKYSQVLANLCENQELLGKNAEQLDELVRSSCIAASTGSMAPLAVVV